MIACYDRLRLKAISDRVAYELFFRIFMMC